MALQLLYKQQIMKVKVRKLNLLDIVSNRKDILWGRDYFGQFKKNKLLNHLIYGKHQDISSIREIYYTDTCSKDLIDDFISFYSQKTRYFLRELDELRDLKEIEVMRECGFLRYSRNYCFDFDANQNKTTETKVHNVYCREIKRSDYRLLAEFDRDCQIVEYRDLLYRNKDFFKNNTDKVFIFTQTQNLNSIVAYAIKREVKDKSVFEIMLSPNQAELIHDCVSAFAEKYVFFEKFDDNFFFIVNESLKSEVERLRQEYNLVWTNQMLIKEGNPRTKLGLTKANFNLNPVTKPV
jgi:hypothetical protein